MLTSEDDGWCSWCLLRLLLIKFACCCLINLIDERVGCFLLIILPLFGFCKSSAIDGCSVSAVPLTFIVIPFVFCDVAAAAAAVIVDDDDVVGGGGDVLVVAVVVAAVDVGVVALR